MNDQAGCFENTRDFPSEEIPLGYREHGDVPINYINYADMEMLLLYLRWLRR